MQETTHLDPGEGAEETDLDLAQFDEEFGEAEIEGFDSVPDGKYRVNVEKVELTRAKSTGNRMLVWTLFILGPEHEGARIWRNSMIITPENLRWLKRDLHRCGLELERLSDLPANLDRLLDVQLEVTQRTKGDSVNVYINRRVDAEDE